MTREGVCELLGLDSDEEDPKSQMEHLVQVVKDMPSKVVQALVPVIESHLNQHMGEALTKRIQAVIESTLSSGSTLFGSNPGSSSKQVRRRDTVFSSF